MSDKKPTPAAMRREIERLKARIGVLEQKIETNAAVMQEHLYDVVDAKIKISQAIDILMGDD